MWEGRVSGRGQRRSPAAAGGGGLAAGGGPSRAVAAVGRWGPPDSPSRTLVWARLGHRVAAFAALGWRGSLAGSPRRATEPVAAARNRGTNDGGGLEFEATGREEIQPMTTSYAEPPRQAGVIESPRAGATQNDCFHHPAQPIGMHNVVRSTTADCHGEPETREETQRLYYKSSVTITPPLTFYGCSFSKKHFTLSNWSLSPTGAIHWLGQAKVGVDRLPQFCNEAIGALRAAVFNVWSPISAGLPVGRS